MLFLRFLLLVVSFGFVALALGVVLYDVYLAFELDRILRRPDKDAASRDGLSIATAESKTDGTAPDAPRDMPTPAAIPSVTIRRASGPRRAIRWQTAAKLVAIAAVTSLTAKSILVVPDGSGAVRISQISGVRPGTMYAGRHLLVPLIEHAQTYDIREKVYATAATEGPKEKGLDVLTVEAREGLSVGIGVTVRYRIDPKRLDYVQANLPQPIDEEIVAPVVMSVFRELGPEYPVRDVFSTKREEFHDRATKAITARLGTDAIIVKEVLLRKIQLPQQYADGLQGLLLKEQEDDQVTVDQSIEAKKVAIAGSQAEAQKVRQIKHAEADARTRVLMAQAESDSMQYTLPLKQKQIEQSRLEAEARKQTTLEDADAAAQARVKNAEAEAKVIDGKAEKERQTLLADAEANQIRVTSQADAEKLQLEAAALKTNPTLVQLTVAQRLSDRVQIMMVPTDGKFFFTNDVLKSVEGSEAALHPSR